MSAACIAHGHKRGYTNPSDLPGDYPAGRASEVTVRQMTPEEQARLDKLEAPKRLPYLAHDRRGRIVAGWEI